MDLDSFSRNWKSALLKIAKRWVKTWELLSPCHYRRHPFRLR